MTTETVAPATDFTLIDEAFRTHWESHAMTRTEGNITQALSSLTETKQEAMIEALHEVIRLYWAGARWDSYREAGESFWTAAQVTPELWRRIYYTDAEACEQMGQWLASQTALVESLPIQTLNPLVTVDSDGPVVTIGGIQYVPLAVVEADLESMRSVIHRGATDNGLCPVYDKVMAASDATTTLLKMCVRPKVRTVYMERRVDVAWRVEVMSTSDEDAERQARALMGGQELVRDPDVTGVYGFRGRYPAAAVVTRVAS